LTTIKHERGVLYLTKPRRKVWQQVIDISQEGGRSHAEAKDLMTQATRLAIEQYAARTADES
jgi:hypothetical protein